MSHSTGPQVIPDWSELPDLPTPLNAGERGVLAALARLGPDWQVFVQPRLSMAQPDFVVVNPRKGIWVLEVKDWNPELYRAVLPQGARRIKVLSGDKWVTRPSPRKQLWTYSQTFREHLRAGSAHKEPGAGILRVLLILPRFTWAQAQALLGIGSLVCGEDVGHLADQLSSAPDATAASTYADELARWLGEPEAVSDQRLPLTLSAQAREIARNPAGVSLRRVRGSAGSGKSMALASRAIELAAKRKEVLIVTFNITLGHYLHDLCARSARQHRVRTWQRNVSFTHFHGLLDELVRQCGEIPARDEDWASWAINVLSAEYSNEGHGLPTFDAILVDEGQDFTGAWWQFLRHHMLRPGGEMLLVADRTQNLFQRANWTDSGTSGGGFSGPWFELKGTYRMPVDLVPIVAEFAQTYLPEDGRDLPSISPEHPVLGEAHRPTLRKWVNVPVDDIVATAADEIEQLQRDISGLSPSDIVLLADHEVGFAIAKELSARGNDTHSLFTPKDGANRKRRKRAFWAGTPGIKGCTVHSFKGWESRAIVCVPAKMGDVALYIAMTRVKAAPSRSAALIVVNAVDSMRAFGSRFEREVLPSEVPALAGQVPLDY